MEFEVVCDSLPGCHTDQLQDREKKLYKDKLSTLYLVHLGPPQTASSSGVWT